MKIILKFWKKLKLKCIKSYFKNKTMNYLAAIDIVKEKQNLIGKRIHGVTIDEIIICPTNPDYFRIFEKTYYKTKSAEFAITPFKHEDVEVGVIFGKKYLIENNLLIEWKTIDWVEMNLEE